MTGATARRPWEADVLSGAMTLVVKLAWGIGDVLLATSAIRRYKELHPDATIVFQTYRYNRGAKYRIQYPMGCPAEMLYGNPDIDQIIDVHQPAPGPPSTVVDLRYAWFGGPSLDYPAQAHYWENLGLQWTPGQRFDAFYYPSPPELHQARSRLAEAGSGPFIAISPHGGWPGKLWRDDRWITLISWARSQGSTAVVLGGDRLSGPPWDQRGVLNLTAKTDIREAGAILSLADQAVLIEGGLSNLRFALGRSVVLLSCATQSGLQVWTPPELTTEVRMVETKDGEVVPLAAAPNGPALPTYRGAACQPCMWRREMVKSASRDVFPASIKDCPTGRSLRDVPASVVIAALLKGA